LLSLVLAAWPTTSKGHVLVLYYTALSIFAGGILGLFMLAFLSKRDNFRGAVAGVIVCLITTAWATLTKIGILDLGGFNYNLHPYLIGPIGHLSVLVVGYVASLLLPPAVERANSRDTEI
jgi:solute:Na+ symporter, SSS family